VKIAIAVLLLVLLFVFGFFGYYFHAGSEVVNGGASNQVSNKVKPLEKFTIENLGKTKFVPSDIMLGEIVADENNFVSRSFYFEVEGKKVSGLLNYPKSAGQYPLIVMSRGYIEREGFKTGDGSRRTGIDFAKAGFVTVAPDFLGYGESDMPSDFAMEERFQTYTTLLTLISSVDKLNEAFTKSLVSVSVDHSKIGLWGHSNGGQITLTVLEVLGTKYPTVLWAPVSKPFPYSILYYTDDFDDRGKALRRVVADFEKDYDSNLYSLTNYLDRIEAPLSIHQGAADSEVPIEWTGDLVLELKRQGKKVEYYTYPEDDHNFTNGNWEIVVVRGIEFYKKSL